MRFWRSPVGAVAVTLLVGVGVILGVTAFQVHRGTTPRRSDNSVIDFESMLIRVDEVEFPAADGLQVAAWLIHGRRDLPPIILCHDAGASKASLINLGIALRNAGFPVLLIDFRGHGASAGERTTLGLFEKRDVLGAVEYLAAHEDYRAKQVGVYGVGMGAHAAVLAAADRPALKVLVLDALYPDAGYRLVREVYADWGFAVNHLGFLPRGVLAVMQGTRPGSQSAGEVVASLVGRDLLFLAPAGDTALADEIQRMYQSVPQQADADGNLVILPATLGDGLYDDQLSRYHERVAGFFSSRLGEPGA